MDYYEKYMKYKMKYIEYKRLHYGGGNVYNFKDISYTNCNTNYNNIICDDVKYKINDNTREINKKNVLWNINNNILNKKYDIDDGYYNNDNNNIKWISEKKNPDIIDKTQHFSSKNTFSMNLKYYDYNNCSLSSNLSFKDNEKLIKEQEFFNIVKDIIDGDPKNFENKVNDIKNLLINITGDIDINTISPVIFIEFLFFLKKIKIEEYELMQTKNSDCEIIYYIDGFLISYLIYDKKEMRITKEYYNLSFFYYIYTKYGKINYYKEYENCIYSLLIKYIIEKFKLNKIILKNSLKLKIDSSLSNIILDKISEDFLYTEYNILYNNNLLFLIKYYDIHEKKWKKTNIQNIVTKYFLDFNDIDKNITSKKYNDKKDIKNEIEIERKNNRFYGPISFKNNIINYYLFNFNNLQIFKKGKWQKASDFQIWAYTDFILKTDKTINYRSKYITDNTAIELDVYGINENIHFSIKYGEYNNILYVNKVGNSLMICDNERVRNCNLLVYHFHKSDKKYIEIKNIDNASAGTPDIPWPKQNWFLDFFKFKESDEYTANKNKMLGIFKNNKIEDLDCGIFEIFSCEELHQLLDIPINNKNKNNKVSIKNLFTRIIKIHNNPEFENSTIQVASQLNCLEMVNYHTTPENGITIYSDDHTQGPACAMCAPAGIAYRNYIYDGGQQFNKQIDMSKKLLDYLKTKDNTITWKVKNGYLLFDNKKDLDKINELLKNTEIFKEAKKSIQSGSHSKQGLFINGVKKDHLINHVYCSGLPISYNNIGNKESWEFLSNLFLEGLYENTLLIAVMNNLLLGQTRPCFLTKVGGGAFGMKDIHIVNAIKKACNNIYNLGFNLEIFLVDVNEPAFENIYSREFNELKICPIS